jgi:hypothetical protein
MQTLIDTELIGQIQTSLHGGLSRRGLKRGSLP